MSALADRVGALVRTVDARWRAEGHALEPFPDVAAVALRDADPFAGMSAADIAEAVVDDDGLGAGVGEAPEDGLPLYEGPRFTVTLRVLVEGHDVPHDHAWSGAYQALASDAWHAAYAFDSAELHDPSFALGALRRTELARVEAGGVIPILPAPRTIHTVCRLARPALGLLVKTTESLSVLSSTYLAPGVRVGAAPPPPNTVQRLRALDAVRSVDPAQWLELLGRALTDTDPRTSFYLLRYAHERAAGRLGSADAADGMERLVGIAERSFGAHTDTVRRALAQVSRRQALDQRVPGAATAAERSLCAALFLADDRPDVDAIFTAVAPHLDAGARADAERRAPRPLWPPG